MPRWTIGRRCSIPTRPSRSRTEEFRLKCDNLEVRQIEPVPGTGEQTTELDAQGNSSSRAIASDTRDKDVMYTARAMRISYNTAKDQLILEGDGRTDVHLYRQLQLGAPWDDTAMKRSSIYPENQHDHHDRRPIAANQPIGPRQRPQQPNGTGRIQNKQNAPRR